ncbi:MAG TPA: hypothetical protein VIK22_13305 [Candidatus Anoxymicrobiaceae bacterium]
MEDEQAVRLKYMIAIAHQCDTVEAFQRAVAELTLNYDIHDCVWPIVGIEEMPMVGEAIIGGRQRAFSYVPPSIFPPGGSPRPAKPVDLDLVKTSDLKPMETRRYLLVPHNTRDIVSGARVTVSEEVSLDTIATVGEKRQGLASLLVAEIKSDFPRVAYKPPFSQQGFVFLLRQEGFTSPSDFYEWARTREAWE